MSFEGAPDGEQPEKADNVVDLVVGGYPYRTTRDVLLSSPFHSPNAMNFFVATPTLA